jgi:carbamoyltransferase
MHVLGISCHYHDAAAALLRDGDLVAAVQEERFSRKKHDAGFPERAIRFCLDRAGITAADLDWVVFYEKPFVKAERLMSTIVATFPRSRRLFRDGMHVLFKEKFWIKDEIRSRLGIDPRRILFIDHHLSHAASALYASPFEEAAILTVDGVGEWTTATCGRGRADWVRGDGNTIQLTHELRFPHSVGLLYSVFTAFLGFEVNEGEYKVMGMAPFGEPKYVDLVRKIIELREDGSLWLDPDYVSFPYHTERSFTRKFETLFGAPRDPRARFVTAQTSLFDDPSPPTAQELQRNQYYADLAASIQKVTEDVMIAMARHLHRQTGLSKLCLAGGVALNCVANYKVLRAAPFEEIFVQPAAGDAGGALGAALYVYHVLLGKPRQYVMDHAYLGQTYGEAEIVDTLRRAGWRYEVCTDDEAALDRVVDALGRGEVIGWYHGAFEWGPRALGARSIIADARRPDMKDIVNIKIKFREPFRPFAPSVLAEKAADWFHLGNADKHYPTRFMLYVTQVANDRVPAITHADGSARPQAVHRNLSPRYYRLIEKFDEATGVPMILNTSFNLKGEPIVSSPADALNTFSKSGMDVLALENVLVRKERPA